MSHRVVDGISGEENRLTNPGGFRAGSLFRLPATRFQDGQHWLPLAFAVNAFSTTFLLIAIGLLGHSEYGGIL